MGNDGDPLFHWGVGAKAALTPSLLIRLRHSRQYGIKSTGHPMAAQCNSFEMLLGLSLTLGRPQPPPPVAVLDSDGDGLVDRVDKCPNEAGAGPDGCPLERQ